MTRHKRLPPTQQLQLLYGRLFVDKYAAIVRRLLLTGGYRPKHTSVSTSGLIAWLTSIDDYQVVFIKPMTYGVVMN